MHEHIRPIHSASILQKRSTYDRRENFTTTRKHHILTAEKTDDRRDKERPGLIAGRGKTGDSYGRRQSVYGDEKGRFFLRRKAETRLQG